MPSVLFNINQPLFFDLLQVTTTKPVFTAEYYALDGITGKVAAFIDWHNASNTLSQAVLANQVDVPATDSSLGNRLSVTFSGSQFYVSNQAASYWTFLSDGSSSEAYTVFTPTNAGSLGDYNTFFDTTNSVSGRSGISVAYRGPTTNQAFCNIQNATAAVVSETWGSVSASTATYIGVSCASGGVTGYIKSSATTLSVLTTFLATAPANTLRIGARNSGIQGLQARVASIVFGPTFSANSRDILQRWAKQTYGIAP